MNLKKFTLSILAMCLCAGVFAQQSKTDPSVEFRPHWNLQLQGGVGYTVGESSKIGDLLSPAAFLSANYKFIPALGVRVGVGGWQAKGMMVTSDAGYKYNFAQLNGDLKVDLNSLFAGYNHRRVCSVYVFGGIGMYYAFNNDEAVAISNGRPIWANELEYLWEGSKPFFLGRFGLGLDFRCSDRVLLNLEANANPTSDHFNSKRADNCDWQLNLLAGISVNLGKPYQTSKVWEAEQAAIAAAERAAAEAEAAAKAAAEKAAAEKAAAEKAAAEKAAAEKAAAELQARALAARNAAIAENSDNVYFTIGSAYIRKAELAKIEKLAAWMEANPDYSVAIVGYADKETGSAPGNLNLSERRAENVKKALVKAGVAEDRIEAAHKGDTVQPFAENAKNRVVICTLE